VPDLIGWVATAIFGVSYLVRRPTTMRLVQAAASLCWILYGIFLHSAPVIVANVIVATMAVFSAWRMAPPASASGEAQTT
jgi:Bacterial inner membrane protein